MAASNVHRPRTCVRTSYGSRWRVVLLVLGISLQSFVFSSSSNSATNVHPATATTAAANSNPTEESSTTLVYSSTNDGNTLAALETTTNQPEEIIFITSAKKVDKEARQRQRKGIYYGTPSGRALFSPRMEYNEWTPVGRGDPLKNDPTFDYSPPVLDRVRYWDSGKEKSNDILLLGVSSKKNPSHRAQNTGPKENSFYSNANSIPMRRNYYMQNLPTILMPPPMQSPVQTPVGETWPGRNIVQDQSTGGTTYISVKANNGAHPNKLPYLHSALQKEITRPQPFSMKQQQHYHPISSTIMMHSPPPPAVPAMPSSPSPFVMHHSQSVYESHSTQTTPLVPSQTMSMATYEQQQQQQMNHMAMMMNGGMAAGAGDGMPMESLTTSLPMHAIHSSQVQFVTENMQPTMMTTTATPPPPPSMTTDSYFSHYNQPQQPIGGPMYLIIEGHSNVKKYGGPEELHAPKIVPVVPTEDSVITHVGSEQPMVRHLHKKTEAIKEESGTGKTKGKLAGDGKGKEKEKDSREEKKHMGGLLSFIDSSLGDFLRAEEEDNSVLDKEEKEGN